MTLTDDLAAALASNARLFWRPEVRLPPSSKIEDDDVCFVTAFFDIGRDSWAHNTNGVRPKYSRSASVYLAWFEHLSAFKNHIVIFTEPKYANDILSAREAFGHKDHTTVFVIDALSEIAQVRDWLDTLSRCFTPRYKSFVWRPRHPEHNIAAYDLIMAMKPEFVRAAIALNAVAEAQTAWIDFGYRRTPLDDTICNPWRLDTRGRLNIFTIAQLDDMPIFQVVRSGRVYISGSTFLAPTKLWRDISESFQTALQSLLQCGFVDDDQTLLLMIARAKPELVLMRPLPNGDFLSAVELYASGRPVPQIELPLVQDAMSIPVWLEELKVWLINTWPEVVIRWGGK